MQISNPQSSIRKRRRRGFSLLEVVIALGILVIGIYYVGRIFPAGRGVVEHAGQRTMAVSLAEKLLKEFQRNPSLLPAAYKSDTSLLPNCHDPLAKPQDGEDRGASSPCNGPSNGVDEIVRVIGESRQLDGGFAGLLLPRFPPFAVFPNPYLTIPGSPPGDDPDVRTPRVYADVELRPFAWEVTTLPATAAWTIGAGDYYYNPGPGNRIPSPAIAGFAMGVPIGAVVFPDPATFPGSYNGPAWSPLPNWAVNWRVFRCSYQWIDTSGFVHHVVAERNKILRLPLNQPKAFRLQATANANFASLVVDENNGRTGSLQIVEEVDLLWRITNAAGLTTGFEPIGFNATGNAAPAAPLTAFAGIPLDTRLKYDYSAAAFEQKRWRWITESFEVPSGGVVKLSVRPLDPDRTINIVRPGGGVAFGISAGVSRTRADSESNCGTGGNCPKFDLPCGVIVNPEVCAVDYEKGEIAFNVSALPVKTPIRISYKPAQDWIVQVQSAPRVYVPDYAHRPSSTSANITPIQTEPGTGYQRFREFRGWELGMANAPAVRPDDPLGALGFHLSELGKTVAVDYVDTLGRTHVGELHTVTDFRNNSNPPAFSAATFPGEARLNNAYRRVIQVKGASVKVRVLWGEKNNYSEASASGTVGVER